MYGIHLKRFFHLKREDVKINSKSGLLEHACTHSNSKGNEKTIVNLHAHLYVAANTNIISNNSYKDIKQNY